MATRISPEESDRKEFLFGLETARSALRERVSELRANIQKIEQDLSAELDRLEKEHTDKHTEYKNKMSSLTSIRINIEDQFKSGEFEELKKSILYDTDKKIEALEREYPPHSVELMWKEGVSDQLKEIGNVVVSVGRREVKQKEIKLDNYITETIPAVVEMPVEQAVDIPPVIPANTPAYELRRKPITTVSLLGCLYPQGIAYDYIDHAVYVLDNISCKLYSYSLVTEQVRGAELASFMLDKNRQCFGQTYQQIILGKGYPGMEGPSCNVKSPEDVLFSPQPYGIDFQKNALIISAKSRNIVTHDFIASISLYTHYQNKYIDSPVRVFGKHGSLEGEMNTPTGLVYSDPNLYVCDSKNNRINVYSNSCIVRTITHPSMYLPLDVKIHEKSLYVLNSKCPLILKFDFTGHLLNEFLIEVTIDPSFFCIDSFGHILITVRRKPYVYVFKKHRREYTSQACLELKHGENRLVEPRGVCLDRDGRVIVVCNNKKDMLQIF